MKKGGTAIRRPFIHDTFFSRRIMKEVIIWFVLMVIIYLFYELFVIHKEKALENMKEGKELTLLSRKYHLDYQKLNLKSVVRTVALTNSFIISTVVTIGYLLQFWISNFFLWTLAVLGIGMILLVPCILIFYSFIGKHYQKIQEGGK